MNVDLATLTPARAHRISQIHLRIDVVKCRQKQAALAALEAAGRLHRSARTKVTT